MLSLDGGFESRGGGDVLARGESGERRGRQRARLTKWSCRLIASSSAKELTS